MANHTGSEGIVKISTNTIAEVRSWTLTNTADTIEDTTMGDSWRTHQSVLSAWSGQVVCYWDETDTTGQGALTSGATVALKLYPEGATTGDIYYSGNAIVTSIERSASFDGMVEATFAFQGTGTLTQATAT
jgi:predicted secreted protein